MAEILYREMPLDIRADDEGGTVTFSASSETPVMRWGDKEILLHGEENVKLDRLRSIGALLVNHDPGQRAGAIIGAELVDGRLEVEARFLTTDFGRQIKTEVEEGALRGISVGYRVNVWEYDEEKREARATDWEVYEASLTPIPADATVGVGRCENLSEDQWRVATGHINDAAPAVAPALPNERDIMSDDIKPQDDAADKVREIEERALVAEAKSITLMRASEHDIKLTEDDLNGVRSVEQGQDLVLRKIATRQPAPKVDVQPTIEIGAEDHEKKCDQIRDAIHASFGVADGEDKGLRGSSILDLGRRYYEAHGVAVPATKVQLAEMMIKRDAANVTSGDFTTYLLANAMSKAVMKGYGNARNTWRRWCVTRSVPDFKTFKGAALDQANLVQTAENLAFPELTKAEDGYSDTLKMWGATVSLTYQAYVNDDLGEFQRLVSQAGAIAARTVEKQVYTEVGAATWTSHTTVTGALGTSGNLGKGVAAFMDRSGQAGEKIGLDPAFIIAPAGLYEDALEQTTMVQGATALVVNDFLTPIITPYLTTATTAANSTYYLAADPMMADTLVVSFLNGVESPMVQEYDAGAVAARKWKIMLPFETTLPANLVGIHQCTQS